MRHLGMAAIVAAVGMLTVALPVQAQVPPPLVDAGCKVSAAEPCHARINFQRQRSFTLTSEGGGTAEFANAGNRRCRLEYSLTNANSASAGRALDLGPSASIEVVLGPGPVSVQFTFRGMGSEECDLMVSAK
jgi:hypothetical protein